ncbi:unnamed protein product [Arctia plantaginis]|uniref:Uncharacterized protein n=1 Tax=Arctia plantaginis TaxID=874455 RepID=A0A8S1A2J8_ARCPL|nr:unnamed protein product [Arctia plantaginis]
MDIDNNLLNAFNLTTSSNNLKLGRSTASVLESHFIEDQIDFADVILAAASKFECPITIDVCRQSLPSLEEHTMKKHTHRRPERNFKIGTIFTPMVAAIGVNIVHSESENFNPSSKTEERHVLKMTAVHNFRNRLIELTMEKYRCTQIPRVLMQLLHVILPSYTKLTKFTIKDCFIDKYTIPELENILSVTNITDVCLDSSFLPEGNYDILLNQATSLQNLSLKRCNINDIVCKQIVSKLHFQQPAANRLLTLNLSSNRITDEGANSIGEALMSNRHLRYLNLADNLITDEGVKFIFDALKEFPLSNNESFDTKVQYMKYLRYSQVISNKRSMDVENNSMSKTRESSRQKSLSKSLRSQMKTVKSKSSSKMDKRSCSIEEVGEVLKSDNTNSDLIVSFKHPFKKSLLSIKDGHSYSRGNLVLSYLNLAYNNLMSPSIQKLLEVLEYQKLHRYDNFFGLIKVVLDGNNLPVNCAELDNVDVLLKEFLGKTTRTKTAIGLKPVNNKDNNKRIQNSS